MSGETKPMRPRKCGAKTRAGGRCTQIAMANGRCHYHGGPSTGPKPEALERLRQRSLRHGRNTREAIALRRENARRLRLLRRSLDVIQGKAVSDADLEELAVFWQETRARLREVGT